MIPLSALSDPSDVVGFVSLAALAVVFGGLPARLVMPCWLRKRREIALIFAVAGLRRGATLAHLPEVAVGLWIASAVIAAASAVTAVLSLAREARRACGS